jgi:pimeloyl-ACP methyl ester carboxylesterase
VSRLVTVRRGDGPPVVFVASLGRPGSDLDVLAEAAAGAGWAAITVDLHGIGSSPELPEGSDLHDIAADVADVLVGGPPAVVVGHAFGNRVARCLAADRPGLVSGLVLLGCGGRVPGDAEARSALRRCFDATLDPAEHRRAVATAFFATDGDASVWMDGWWAGAAERQEAALAVTSVDDWWLPPDPVRVLAVVGADDRISPPANAASLVESLGGRGELLVVPGAGHALVPERPAEVAAALVGFLGTCRVPPPPPAPSRPGHT